MEPIQTPVCTDVGSIYEFEAIKEWLMTHDTDPAPDIILHCCHLWWFGTLRTGPSRPVQLMQVQKKSAELQKLPFQCRYLGVHDCNSVNF